MPVTFKASRLCIQKVLNDSMIEGHPPPRSGLGPRKVCLKAEDNGFWVLTSPSRMSPDISLFSATHDILAPQEHRPLPSPRAVPPASPCGQHGCLQCVSPSRAVCSASGLFLVVVGEG